MRDIETRRILETRLTAAEFLKDLVHHKVAKLPERRYRVEHKEEGQGGNSHLVNLDDAKETARLFPGGVIVELISTLTFYRATAKNLDNSCEDCNAAKGEPCLSDPADPTSVIKPHDVRMGKESRADRAAKKLPACPKCNAKESRPCRNKAGHKQMPHPKRKPPKEKKVKVPIAELDRCDKCGADAGQHCHAVGAGAGLTIPNIGAPDAKVRKVTTHAGRRRIGAAA